MSSSTSTTVTRSQSKAAASEVNKQEEKVAKADDNHTQRYNKWMMTNENNREWETEAGR